MPQNYPLDEGEDGEKSDGENPVSLGVDPVDSIDCVDDEDGPESEGEIQQSIGDDEDRVENNKFVVGDSAYSKG